LQPARSTGRLITDMWRTGSGRSKRFGEPPVVAGGDDIPRPSAATANATTLVAAALSACNHKLACGSGRSALTLVYSAANPPTSAQLTSLLHSSVPNGVTVHATSLGDLQSGNSSRGVGVLGEGVIAGVAALLVLAVVFGPLLALDHRGGLHPHHIPAGRAREHGGAGEQPRGVPDRARRPPAWRSITRC
jgi:hypothetical protein